MPLVDLSTDQTALVQFVAFTDSHRSLDFAESVRHLIQASKVPFAVCAGDFTFFEQNLNPAWRLMAGLDVPIYFIHGNHEGPEFHKTVTRSFPNCRYVGLRADTITLPDGLKVQAVGLDGEDSLNPRKHEDDEAFGTYHALLENWIDGSLPLILVTHYPPADTNCCGREPVWSGSVWTIDKLQRSVGSEVVRRLVEVFEPAVVVCGHFHERFKKSDRIGESEIVNPGPDGEILRIKAGFTPPCTDINQLPPPMHRAATLKP